jgi:hypothetical protein
MSGKRKSIAVDCEAKKRWHMRQGRNKWYVREREQQGGQQKWNVQKAVMIPIFKLTYRTLCEYSSSLTHFIRRFSRRHRMAVTRETQGQEDTHTCGLERTMQLLRSDKLPKRSKGTYVSSMLHVILSRVCVRKVEAQGVESWVAKSPERLC